jgi:hypothetical protein
LCGIADGMLKIKKRRLPNAMIMGQIKQR